MKSGLIFHDIKIEIPVKTGVTVRYYHELMYIIYDTPYCWLHFVSKVKYKIEAAMQYVLDNIPESFVRCNRSVIINLCYYKEYRRTSSEVVMQDDTVFSLSRLNTHNFNTMRINMPYMSLPYAGCYACTKECENKSIFYRRKTYKKIPVISNFVDENGVDRMKEMIKENYDRIKSETKQIVADELENRNDENLCHLLSKQGE